MNTEITIHPKLQHVGLTTGNLQQLLNWYKNVLGMRLIFLSENPTGSAGASVRAAWLSNDDVNHRLAVVEIPLLIADPDRSRHHRLQHVAFEYRTLDELLGTYLRLKNLGILPVLSVDEGSQIGFYYNDPDGNIIELNANNYGDQWTAIEHIQNSPDFARRPLGVDVDPEKMIAARTAGASAWDLHERAVAGEFVPPTPYDLRALL